MLVRLLLLFIGVPLIELVLFLHVGEWIGLWWTVAIVILTGVAGAALARSQGFRVWHRFQGALAAGRLPHAEMVEGLLVLIAGALLLTPGFLTDASGFFLLVPPARAWVVRRMQERLRAGTGFTVDVDMGMDDPFPGGREGFRTKIPRTRGPVIDVESLDRDD